MLKTSRYMVSSDREYKDARGRRYRLVFSTRTASLIPVPSAIADSLENGRVGDIPQSEVPHLREAELLVPAEQDELSRVLAENTEAARDPSSVKFTLLPTSYCNMGCSYCGQLHSRGRLSAEHRDRVRARVLRRIELETTRTVQIDWFGSEPMIGYPMILDLSTDFVRAADWRGLTYWSSITTNGTLLTIEKIGVLVKQCRLAHFEVALDGPPDVHDVHRPLKAGGGSFWKIVRTIQKAVVDSDFQSVNFQFRTNVDTRNQDHITEYLELMGDLGFARNNVSFSIAPVHSWGNDVSDIAMTKRDFADREVKWLELMHRRGLRVGTLPRRRRKVVCGAVSRATEYISSTGNVFSCSEFPLVAAAEKGRALGNIGQDDLPLVRPMGPFDAWNESVAAGKSWCRDCVFLPVCGGACPKSWMEGTPPCPSYKFNFQSRLEIAAAREGYRDAGIETAEGAGG